MSKHVLLLGDNFRATIALAKELKHDGLNVTVVGWNDLPLRYSKHIDSYFSFPINQSVSTFVEKLMNLLKDNSYDFIIPINDDAIVVARLYRKEIEEYLTIIGLEDDCRLNFVIDKMELYQLLKDEGVHAPKTLTLESFIEVKEKVYPFIIKPRRARTIIEDKILTESALLIKNDKAFFVAAAKVKNDFWMVQEYIDGEEIGFNFFSINGDILMCYFDKQLHGIIGSEASCRVTISPHKETEKKMRRVIKSMGWTGLGMFDIKLFNDTPYVLEMNGRPWASIQLSTYIGINVMNAFVNYFIEHKPIKTVIDYKVGFRLRNLKMDFKYAISLLGSFRLLMFLKWKFSLLKLFSTKEFLEDGLFDDFRFQCHLYYWHFKNIFK